MNSIPIAQNGERQIHRLAAQRQLYATAKQVFGWQAVVSGPAAVVISLVVLSFPEWKAYGALWGIVVSLADVAWLTPWQRRLRNAAASIQELFDCDVLELPWDELRAGRMPDSELVREKADKYARWAASMPPLTNWYAVDAGSVPLHVGRLICQRSNCWWDASQRRRYAATVAVCVIGVAVALAFVGIRGQFSVEDFVLRIAAPLSPALLLGYRQFTEQLEAASRVDKLKEHAERLWRDALAGAPESEISARSRRLQDEILEHRRRSPLVFDAIFKRLRRDFEIRMNHGARELAAEAKLQLRI